MTLTSLKPDIKFTPGVFPFSKVPRLENPNASAPFLDAILSSVFKSKLLLFFIICNSSKIERELLLARLSVPTQSFSGLNIL